MNAKARRKEKAHNPAGKVTRRELDALCDRLSKDFTAIYWVFDLILEKGLFTPEELGAFLAKKRNERRLARADATRSAEERFAVVSSSDSGRGPPPGVAPDRYASNEGKCP